MTNINRRQFILAAGALAGSAVLGGCGGSSDSAADTAEETYTLVKEGTLTNVAELGFAPFEYIDEDGNTVGFDVDLSEAIAEKLGLACEWLPNQSFDTLVPTIKAGGKADISIAGITISDERLEDVDFTDPYLDSNQGIITLADSAETEESLNAAGKSIACQSGTTGNDWILENLPEAECVPLADVTAGLMGVSTGLYAAMVIDLPVAENMLTNSFSDLAVLKEIPTGEQYGIAVSKDNPKLTEAINAALAEMESDGTMAEIKTKWFGSEI